MDNQIRHIRNLFSRYAASTASSADVEELLDLLAKGDFDDEVLLEMQAGMDHAPDQELDQKRWSEVLMEIQGRISLQPEQRTRTLWPRIGIAAAVATIIVSAGIWFYHGSQKDTTEQVMVVNDVAPGKQSATLTLANGKKIRLTDAVNGELAKEAGVVITKSADGQLVYEVLAQSDASDKINVLSTSNGETYWVRLPDGSAVWLNAASSLRYPASFAKFKDRRVELSGEGYFEVAKDKAHPFIVKTGKQEVEVLGTQFNINSYADEPAVATTLLEGSVKLSVGNSDKLLKPGEQALNADGNIKLGKANIESIIDWKNEEFYLDKMDFRVAMRKIARWYNIEVIYNGSVPANLEAGGWIPRDSKLSDVLKAIESSGLAHFKIEGRKLYVSK